MNYVTSKVVWVLKLLKDLKCENLSTLKVLCDNNAPIKIVENPFLYEI